MKKIYLVLTILLYACGAQTPINNSGYMTPQPDVESTIVTDETSVPITDFSSTTTLPSGPLTLVALGDSLTQGDGDDSGRGYPVRVLEMVNSIRPDSTITNLGQSGWNSDALINGDQGLESQLERAIVELQNATVQGRGAVAFVWIGSNDLWYLYEYGGDGTDEGDAIDAEHFSANMEIIISRLRATGAVVFVALLDDQSKRPVAIKGEAFTSITQDELNRMSAQAQRYNEIIAERAAQYGAWTVDFYHTDIFSNPATLYDDGNHPNQTGYDIIAQKWFDALLPFIQ